MVAQSDGRGLVHCFDISVSSTSVLFANEPRKRRLATPQSSQGRAHAFGVLVPVPRRIFWRPGASHMLLTGSNLLLLVGSWSKDSGEGGRARSRHFIGREAKTQVDRDSGHPGGKNRQTLMRCDCAQRMTLG